MDATTTLQPRDTRLVAAAEDLFGDAQLPPPRLPAYLAAALRTQNERLRSTRPLPASPYLLSQYLEELDRDPAIPAYAIVGFDGHGLNSWAAHCYVVSDAAALFIQLPWGGAYLDIERARADVTTLFDWSATLQTTLQQAFDADRIPRGWRLQVAASAFRFAGWRWWIAGRDNASQPWQDPVGMKAALQAMAEDLLHGRRVLAT